MWFWILLSGWAQASCERTTTATEVGERLDAAGVSLGEGELPRFEEDLALVELALQCLDEPVSPELAARLHRFWGIRAFAGGAKDTATSHFVTARALTPDQGLPVYPEGHPIQAAFRAGLEPRPLKVKGPGATPLFVDGTEAVQLDNAGAHLLQYQGDAEQLAYYQLPAGARPPWMAPPAERRSPLKPVLLGLGAASLAGAVGCGIANIVAGQGFINAGFTDRTELEKRQRTTNTFLVATGATGALGIGLVVGGVLAPGGRR